MYVLASKVTRDLIRVSQLLRMEVLGHIVTRLRYIESGAGQFCDFCDRNIHSLHSFNADITSSNSAFSLLLSDRVFL
jgi:hypothetical protein